MQETLGPRRFELLFGRPPALQSPDGRGPPWRVLHPLKLSSAFKARNYIAFPTSHYLMSIALRRTLTKVIFIVHIIFHHVSLL